MDLLAAELMAFSILPNIMLLLTTQHNYSFCLIMQKIEVSIENSLCGLNIPHLPFLSLDKILLHDLDIRLDGVANTAMVELGDVPLAGYFAEKRFSQQPFFRNGKSR